jgi:hypothetical protein
VLLHQLVEEGEIGPSQEGAGEESSDGALSARGRQCLLEINELEHSDRPTSSHALSGLKSLDKDVQSSIDNVGAVDTHEI